MTAACGGRADEWRQESAWRICCAPATPLRMTSRGASAIGELEEKGGLEDGRTRLAELCPSAAVTPPTNGALEDRAGQAAQMSRPQSHRATELLNDDEDEREQALVLFFLFFFLTPRVSSTGRYEGVKTKWHYNQRG